MTATRFLWNGNISKRLSEFKTFKKYVTYCKNYKILAFTHLNSINEFALWGKQVDAFASQNINLLWLYRVFLAYWINYLRYTILRDKYECQELFLKGFQITIFFQSGENNESVFFWRFRSGQKFLSVFVGENVHHLKKILPLLSDKVFLNSQWKTPKL